MPDNNDAELAQLWQRFARARSRRSRESIRNELAIRYLWLVTDVATNLSRNCPSHITVEELASAGNEGLLQAIESFDQSRKTKPTTYFRCRVRGAMLDLLRNLDYFTRLDRRRLKQVERLEQHLGRHPTDEEIADSVGVPESQAAWYRQRPQILSLNCAIDQRHTIADQIGGWDDPTVLDGEQFGELLRGCSKRERLLVQLYYADQLTMGEIGQALGISESRVSQIHSDLLARLRKKHAA